MNKFLSFCGLITFISFLLYLSSFTHEAQLKEIESWAVKNHFEIKEVKKTYFDNGPFWFTDEDDTIYRVKINDTFEKPRVIYFKFGIFGSDKKWSD